MFNIDAWLDALEGLYDQWGYLIVFLGSLFENTALLGLVLPGGTLALLGAFYAQQGVLNIVWVIVFAWIGTVLGYHADYLVGRFLLLGFLARWSDSWLGRRLRIAGRVRLARRFLSRHGGKAILISHVIGHIRSFIALSAGATRMPYRRFLGFELVAALLWNTVFCLLGYFLGSERERLQFVLERSGWVVLVVVFAAYLGWRILAARRSARSQGRLRARAALARVERAATGGDGH